MAALTPTELRVLTAALDHLAPTPLLPRRQVEEIIK